MKGKTLINKLLIKIMLLIKELNVKYHISFSTMLRIKVCPYSYFCCCGCYRGLWVSFDTPAKFSMRVTKNYFKDWCLMILFHLT